MPTVAQLQQNIDSLLGEWQANFVPLFRAVSDIKGEMFVRIFGSGSTGGSNTADQKLPTEPYSTKPLYVDPRSVRNAPSQFKVGKKDKPIQSLYFPDGYSQLKTQTSATLPLELTGRLKSDFASAPIFEQGLVAQISIDQSEAGKVEGLERKYGTIFEMTDQELQTFLEYHADYITEQINKALE